MNKQFVNSAWMLKGLFSKESHKRDMAIWFALVMKMALDDHSGSTPSRSSTTRRYAALVQQRGGAAMLMPRCCWA